MSHPHNEPTGRGYPDSENEGLYNLLEQNGTVAKANANVQRPAHDTHKAITETLQTPDQVASDIKWGRVNDRIFDGEMGTKDGYTFTGEINSWMSDGTWQTEESDKYIHITKDGKDILTLKNGDIYSQSCDNAEAIKVLRLTYDTFK